MFQKVYQTKFGLGGNCASAVHATFLGLSIDEVPYYNHGLGEDCDLPQEEKNRIFNERIADFLKKYDLAEYWYLYDDEVIQEHLKANPNIYYQVVGKSPRDYMHCVIYHNGKLWHDPHPEGGDVEHTYIVLFGKYEPNISVQKEDDYEEV